VGVLAARSEYEPHSDKCRNLTAPLAQASPPRDPHQSSPFQGEVEFPACAKQTNPTLHCYRIGTAPSFALPALPLVLPPPSLAHPPPERGRVGWGSWPLDRSTDHKRPMPKSLRAACASHTAAGPPPILPLSGGGRVSRPLDRPYTRPKPRDCTTSPHRGEARAQRAERGSANAGSGRPPASLLSSSRSYLRSFPRKRESRDGRRNARSNWVPAFAGTSG
jgi:hypothetical protein